MPDSKRLRASRPESGRTEVMRLDGGSVVAQHTVGEGGVNWIHFTRFDDTPISESEENRPLPKK